MTAPALSGGNESAAGEGFTYVGGELDLFASAVQWKAYFATLLRPWIAGRVLEVGAGIGATTRSLWHDAAVSWTCLEPDATLASRLRDLRLGDDAQMPEVIVGGVPDLDAGRRFDTILYIDVLEHIEDDEAELLAACRLLADGGRLVVLSPAFQFLYSPFDAAIGHYRRYTKRSLASVMPGSMVVRRLFYADSVGLMLSLGNALFLKQSIPNQRQVDFWDRRVIPVSRHVDPLFRRWFGRSVVVVAEPKPLSPE